MHRVLRALLVGSLVASSWGAASAQDATFGDIDFPTSGTKTAQPYFVEGVAAMHSFQWAEAAIAFDKALEIDPSFAMAYWGKAMSYNHPLWAQQDTENAKATLERLAPTLHDRRLKAGLEKEKGWLNAVDVLYYTPGDKLTRDIAYSEAMAAMYARWPEDHEVQIFYALSLLGTVRPGDQGFRRQALAASISAKVFAENPNHPGAAHFIIHSFDDPDHAILALPAAEIYAGIAPKAAHALHMPSHIFVQLGKWDRVVLSNIDAYDAAIASIEHANSPPGGEDFHTLSWLAYGYLMLGDTENAERQIQRAKDSVKRYPGNENVYRGYLNMRARHILESDDAPALSLEPADTPEGSNQSWVATVGMTAARSGDLETAEKALARLTSMREKAGKGFGAQQLQILEGEVRALIHEAKGEHAEAAKHAKAAADIEQAIGAPSGPPNPIKPALELYAEILLESGRHAEAVAAFKKSLQWIPLRTPSVLGLARAAKASGDKELAKTQYQILVETPGASASSAAVKEAKKYLSQHGA